MSSFIVRAFILLAIFCLGVAIGSYYSKADTVQSPVVYTADAEGSISVIDHIPSEVNEEVNALTEIGKKLASIVTTIMRVFVEWIIGIVP